jgi:hypothetical protein
MSSNFVSTQANADAKLKMRIAIKGDEKQNWNDCGKGKHQTGLWSSFQLQ